MVRLSPRSFRVVGEHEQVKQLSSAPVDADHVGALLAETRQSFGFDLSTVANALCIRTIYLQAIEEGRYADLPGVTYAVGFVRTYADYLGLDGDALVARFKSESAAWRAPRPLVLPETRPEKTFPGATVIAVSGLLVAAVFGAWVTWRDQPTEVAVTIGTPPGTPATVAEAPPPRVAATTASAGTIEIPITPAGSPAAPEPGAVAAADPAPAPAPLAASPAPTSDQDAPVQIAAAPPVAAPPEAPATPTPPTPPSPTPATPTLALDPVAPNIVPSAAQLAAPAPLPVGPALTVPTPPAAAAGTDAPLAAPQVDRPGTIAAVAAEPSSTEDAAPQVAALPAVPGVDAADTGPGREYGLANRDARIVLRAVAESWIQVRDLQQNVVLTRMLQPGDSYRVPNRPDLTLLTGNAGGLEITVDGVAIAPLGPSGAVRRDVPLLPDSLRGAN